LQQEQLFGKYEKNSWQNTMHGKCSVFRFPAAIAERDKAIFFSMLHIFMRFVNDLTGLRP